MVRARASPAARNIHPTRFEVRAAISAPTAANPPGTRKKMSGAIRPGPPTKPRTRAKASIATVRPNRPQGTDQASRTAGFFIGRLPSMLMKIVRIHLGVRKGYPPKSFRAFPPAGTGASTSALPTALRVGSLGGRVTREWGTQESQAGTGVLRGGTRRAGIRHGHHGVGHGAGSDPGHEERQGQAGAADGRHRRRV